MTIEQSILALLAEGPATTVEIRGRVDDEVELGGNEMWTGFPPFDHSIRARLSRLVKSGKIIRTARAMYSLPKRQSRRRQTRDIRVESLRID